MIKVNVLKMLESSGNVMFFGRAYNTETKESLDYCSAQTKDGFTVNECMERVWFEVGFLAQFFGISNNDIGLLNFTDDEKLYIVEQLSINPT